MQTDNLIEGYTAKLDQRHLENLGHLLELELEHPGIEDIRDGIRWCYHSRIRHKLRSFGADAITTIDPFRSAGEAPVDASPAVPSYAQLIEGLGRKFGIKDDTLSIETREKQLIYSIISECLHKMNTEERVRFFETSVDVSAVLGTGIIPSELRAPLQTLSLIGLANTVGGSLYVGASTALGMITHAVGVTLPHAVLGGLGATVGFLIGPAGWLAAGSWMAWRATGPDWRILAQVVVYLITHRENLALETHAADISPAGA